LLEVQIGIGVISARSQNEEELRYKRAVNFSVEEDWNHEVDALFFCSDFSFFID